MTFDRIAVTGGAGRLGRFVVEELSRHAEVTVLDKAPDSSSRHRHITLDILDLAAVYTALDGHQAVIHLAAIDDAIEATPKRYFETNVEGTFNLLQAAMSGASRKLPSPRARQPTAWAATTRISRRAICPSTKPIRSTPTAPTA